MLAKKINWVYQHAVTRNRAFKQNRWEAMKTKFIFVTGGVLSSLGKGLAAASLGALEGSDAA